MGGKQDESNLPKLLLIGFLVKLALKPRLYQLQYYPMKRLLLLNVFVCCSILATAQNWQATNLTNVAYLPIASFDSHNNELYATYTNGASYSLYKLNANNTSWTMVNTGNVTGIRDVLSAGTRMYVSTLASGIVSNVYYSYDNGSTFTIDTAGLPPYFGGISTISGLQYHKGKVIANVGANGYYIKDTTAYRWTSIDPPTKMNGGADPMICVTDTIYAYDNTGTNTFYRSADWGVTWVPGTTGLPADFKCSKLAQDPVSGLIYAAGFWNQNNSSGLYVSDNYGFSWWQINLSSYIDKNINNTAQGITAIYANWPDLYIGLENDKTGTVPNVLGSTNGLQGIAYDTLGLPAAGAVYPIKFMRHKGKLVTALQVIDLYLKDTGNGIEEKIARTAFSVFPNPVSDKLNLDYPASVTSIKVLDIQGRELSNHRADRHSINTDRLQPGTYFVQFFEGEKLIGMREFIK